MSWLRLPCCLVFALAFAGVVLGADSIVPGWADIAPRGDLQAFGETRWGMSRAQIEQRSGARLRAADPAFMDYFGPEGISRERLSDFEQRGQTIDGAPSLVSYRLLDDGLYQVLVEQQGPPAWKARDIAIRAALSAVYGEGSESTTRRDDEIAAREWHLPSRRVRYWMLDDRSEPEARRTFIGVEFTDPNSAATAH